MLPTPAPTPRFRYLDGLRGVAAASVLLHHAFHGSEFKEPLTRLFGPAAERFTAECSRGVQIFFVLSGFVIAYSIRKMWVTPKVAGNFILRRQIRLDPAFWIVLVLAYFNLLGSYLLNIYESAPVKPTASRLLSYVFYDALGPHHLPYRPTFTSFFTSMFYVNNILHVPRPILGVSWTLCLEIQFYLILILLLWLSQRFFKSNALRAQTYLVGILALASLAFRILLDYPLFNHITDKDGFPWFIGNWFFFAAGVMTYWTIAKRMRPATLLGFTALIMAAGLFHPPTLGPALGPGLDHERHSLILGAIAIALVYGIGVVVFNRPQHPDPAPSARPAWPVRIANLADAGLSTSPLLYLGRISYSLYLIHFIVLDRVYRLGMHLMHVSSGSQITPPWALFWFVTAIICSIICADILYRLVERPTMRLASALKPRTPAEPSAPPESNSLPRPPQLEPAA